jgi:transglutaminase-like putative cysteine protease
LPGILPTPLGRLSNSQAQTDWRHSPRQVEVRGGNHTLSEREVLKIRLLSGQSQGYWRGRVYQNYTASSWQDDTRSFKDARLRFSQLTPLELHETLPPLDTKLGREVTVKAEMAPLAFLGSPVPLYGAGRITAMRAAWSDIDINTRTSAVTLTWSPFTYSAEPQYTVESKYIEPLAASLRARSMTDTELKEWRGNEATAPTLELPDDALIKEPIQRIAQEIITSAQQQGRKIDTPRAKAQAISAYLHANCVYSLNAPLAPSTDDGVAYFLTTSKLGACDMFASAMALLLRAMDVPARLATGYLEPEAAPGVTRGEIIIREKDAHAWVEYWVPEVGWITHDPSAGTRVADDGMMKNLSQTLTGMLRRIGGTTVLLPVLGVLLLVAGIFWPQIEKMMGRSAQPADAQSRQRAQVSRAYAQATRMLRRHIHGRRYSLAPFTPRELDDVVGRANLSPEAKQEFAALTYLHAAARYAPTAPEVSETQLKESLARLRQALR